MDSLEITQVYEIMGQEDYILIVLSYEFLWYFEDWEAHWLIEGSYSWLGAQASFWQCLGHPGGCYN